MDHFQHFKVQGSVLEMVEAYCIAVDLSESAFGRRAVGDSRFVGNLRDGRGSISTMQRAIDFICDRIHSVSPGQGRGSACRTGNALTDCAGVET